MASFSSAAFDTNAFSVNAWDFGTPIPPAPTGTTGGGVRKHYVRINLRDGKREDLAEMLKATLRERYPEPVIVPVPAAEKPRRFTVKHQAKNAEVAADAIAAMEIEMAQETRRRIQRYNEQILQLIALAVQDDT